MRTPSGVIFSANVQAIPNGASLKNVGPVLYAGLLRKRSSSVRIVSNNLFLLKDGTTAYWTDIRRQSKGLSLNTVVVSAFKDRHWVSIITHHRNNTSVAAEIAESLVFLSKK